jgi:hypothetical protein
MSRADAAKYLGISEKTLANRQAKGKGPRGKKVLGRIFYFQDELDDIVESGGE